MSRASRLRSTEKRKKEKSKQQQKSAAPVRQMTKDMKRRMMDDTRLRTLESNYNDLAEMKSNESKLMADLMFSVNAIVKALAQKTFKMTVADRDEEGNIRYDIVTGTLITKMVEVPLVTMSELNNARLEVIEDFKRERDLEDAREKAAADSVESATIAEKSSESTDVDVPTPEDVQPLIGEQVSSEPSVESHA